PMSVRAAIDRLHLAAGDMAILNDPYAGGTHLPDITMVLPVFHDESAAPAFYVAARAHHADVGGMYPGSMGLCREIYQEGLRIPPLRIMKGGTIDREILNLLLHNVRTPIEREGDLTSQIGACRVGEARLREIIAKYGTEDLRSLTRALLDYSERLMRAELADMPGGEFAAEDFLDDDGFSDAPVKVRVAIHIDPQARTARVDFSGSGRQVNSSINAVYAVTYSAVYYVFRCLLSEAAPATAGMMRPIEVFAPEGTVINARPPAPVAGGNVEMSQRIVDVLLKALAAALPQRIPAASSGTMNNLTIGGIDPRTNLPFAYYETVAGGMGARPGADGISGVHTHMTNSLNTPVEALEYAYPMRLRQYGYRPNSGGQGSYRGGDGLVREIELLADAQITLLADRRKFRPYGLAGGEAGAAGTTTLLPADGESQTLPGKCSISAHRGDVIRIETPGGGGWGDPERPASQKEE
ncbi:MAG TPA: hydantoinase B/oxoprolinase family protein, partial [Terriglobales bacterium]